MATAKQLKALRKKYYLGEFRKSKGKIFKRRASSSNMAKRRSRRTSRRSSRGFGSMGGITSQVAPILVAYGYERYISPMIPVSNSMTKNVIETGLSYYLAKKGGIVGSAAKVVFIVETYNLLSQLIGSSGSAPSGSAYY